MSDPKLIATVQLHLTACLGEDQPTIVKSLASEIASLKGMDDDAVISIDDFEIDSLRPDDDTEKVTVIFFTDIDSVETYIQHVEVKPGEDAFDLAVEQAKVEWAEQSSPSDWENATEVARFPGHIHEIGGAETKPLFSTFTDSPSEVDECDNCGNTEQDGSPVCVDCGNEQAFR